MGTGRLKAGTLPLIGAVAVAALALGVGWIERHSPRFDAEYVGSETCGKCHTGIYPEWQRSPHANMTRRPGPLTVVGDFDDGQWMLPAEAWRRPGDDRLPAARMFEADGRYYMALRHPGARQATRFEIAYVIGYQYRQVYLTREAGGVLRRLPLQWSTLRREFFPYWNLQEGSEPTLDDLWAQMRSANSAWNLYCARCHTTHLQVLDKDRRHTRAQVQWTDEGIACEACHGPGSLHVDYFRSNYANRLAAWINSKLRGERVAYIANAAKLDKGRAMSVCARCHGADILMTETDIYRRYEPGYSRTGRTNDLSAYFQKTPLTPDRAKPTVEVYSDGEPKGIGMLFRSLIESSCYQQAEVRCFDCHNPHDNKQAAAPYRLVASAESNAYCLGCHAGRDRSQHVRHERGEPGSFCYDCHMPRIITKLATGVLQTTRTHRMSSIPDTAGERLHGAGAAPNACNGCHTEQPLDWTEARLAQWYGAAAPPADAPEIAAAGHP